MAENASKYMGPARYVVWLPKYAGADLDSGRSNRADERDDRRPTNYDLSYLTDTPEANQQ